MIKHHPDLAMLGNFVEGDLPASIAAAVAVHIDMCPKCKAKCNELTEQQAEQLFSLSELSTSQLDLSEPAEEFGDVVSLEQMIAAITENDEIDLAVESREETISVQGKQYKLPRALTNLAMGKWTSIGSIARARLALDEEPIRASLLQIQPGGAVPEHTHKGFELTLLLEGHFKDDMGEYGPGDFIILDGRNTHSPVTDDGCLCYTVSNDAQRFTQGLNKLLNPIGSLIY